MDGLLARGNSDQIGEVDLSKVCQLNFQSTFTIMLIKRLEFLLVIPTRFVNITDWMKKVNKSTSNYQLLKVVKYIF